MRLTELGKRYAKALFMIATENKVQEKVFSDLRALEQIFVKDTENFAYLTSATVKAEEKEKVVAKAVKGAGLSPEVENLVGLLAERNRLGIFTELVSAFESEIDAANGVARGAVSSATTLAPDDRQRIEKMVESVLKKKVIMNYKVDANLIGGLVARVGSYVFDDSLDSHLNRIHEDLKVDRLSAKQ